MGKLMKSISVDKSVLVIAYLDWLKYPNCLTKDNKDIFNKDVIKKLPLLYLCVCVL